MCLSSYSIRRIVETSPDHQDHLSGQTDIEQLWNLCPALYPPTDVESDSMHNTSDREETDSMYHHRAFHFEG